MTVPGTDETLRRRFKPLAEHRPSAAEVAELRSRLPAARRRAPRWPRIAVPAIAAAAGAVALALPGGEPAHPGPNVLLTAAAIAAERPVPPVAAAPFRYTRSRQAMTYEVRRDGRVAAEVHVATVETWVGARWRGHERGSPSRTSWTGDRALARASFGPEPRRFHEAAYGRPFAYGDGPLARLDPTELPQDRARLARVLSDGIRRDRWGPYARSRGRSLGLPDDMLRSTIARHMILLLVYARLTGTQRAALLDVLSTQTPAQDLGAVSDDLGRSGRGVLMTFPIRTPRGYTHTETYRIVFDPESAEILQWTMEPRGGATPWSPRRTEVVLESGWAQTVGGAADHRQ